MSDLTDSPIWQVLWKHAEGDELLEYEQFVQRYEDLKAKCDRLREALQKFEKECALLFLAIYQTEIKP